jgi:hypothetical protein
MRWRRLFFPFSMVLACLLTAVLFSRCYTPTYSDCAFRCGDMAMSCPSEYQCQQDGYCHLPGSTTICGFPSDMASTASPGDLQLDAW